MRQAVVNPLEEFAHHGCAVLPAILDDGACEDLLAELGPLLEGGAARRPGARAVLRKAPGAVAILRASPVRQLLEVLAGPDVRIVRSILFDKSPSTNWLVPWHQDPTISVAARVDAPGFGPWSTKDGEPHCQPPRPVLDAIGILRLHLDACPAESGPLRIVPSSHDRGILGSAEVDALARAGPVVECVTPRGGGVLMRPLSVHSSPKAEPSAGRRRILHLEWTAESLPGGLAWSEAERLS